MSTTCGNYYRNYKSEDCSIAIVLDRQSEKNEGSFLAWRKKNVNPY